MRIIFFFLVCFVDVDLAAQCTTTITSYPYVQDFEVSNGSWSTGGTASDWQYGTPVKPTITGAASGTKCWIAGGLTASSYNNGENSWLMSPCYDFTTLTSPLIRFKVFWETEKRWDGASLEYSTDNGSTWQKAGSAADSTNCYTSHWFNYSSINNVGEGWSGTVQASSGSCVGGGGSGQWVQAQHQFPSLAGVASVRFRFTFAAGTTCNNYDGFAIDDFTVMNTPMSYADFTYTCGVNRSAAFNNTSFFCPANYQWDFGDPTTGAANTSTAKDPVHVFSAPGSYTATLSATSGTGPVLTIAKTITILGAVASIATPVSCHNTSDGAVSATASGSTAAYTFTWNTSPLTHGAVVTGLPAGNYTVDVTSGNACPASATVTLSNPSALTHAVTINDASCGRPNGSATITEAGGTSPYAFTWMPSGGNAASAGNLSPGHYVAHIKDNNQCADSVSINIADVDSLLVTVDSIKDVSCFAGSNGSVTVSATRGTGGYTYTWSPTGGNSNTASNLKAGDYRVTATDGGGCVGTLGISIHQPPAVVVSLGGDTVICPGTKLLLSPGIFSAYRWQDNSTASTYTAEHDGMYYVQVTNAAGCTASDSINVSQDCHDIVFPSAFTPNGDGRNDVFKPLGTLSVISRYTLSVYNRWGQLVFQTHNPYLGWDGLVKYTDPGTGAFVWTAEYSFDQLPLKSVKGMVMIIK